jgi:hypothetical protein
MVKDGLLQRNKITYSNYPYVVTQELERIEPSNKSHLNFQNSYLRVNGLNGRPLPLGVSR